MISNKWQKLLIALTFAFLWPKCLNHGDLVIAQFITADKQTRDIGG